MAPEGHPVQFRFLLVFSWFSGVVSIEPAKSYSLLAGDLRAAQNSKRRLLTKSVMWVENNTSQNGLPWEMETRTKTSGTYLGGLIFHPTPVG